MKSRATNKVMNILIYIKTTIVSGFICSSFLNCKRFLIVLFNQSGQNSTLCFNSLSRRSPLQTIVFEMRHFFWHLSWNNFLCFSQNSMIKYLIQFPFILEQWNETWWKLRNNFNWKCLSFVYFVRSSACRNIQFFFSSTFWTKWTFRSEVFFCYNILNNLNNFFFHICHMRKQSFYETFQNFTIPVVSYDDDNDKFILDAFIYFS